MATEASASALLASSGICAHAVRSAGGVAPSGASAAVPGSMTSATRLLPSSAGVAAQIFVKSGARRGLAASCESALTANRKPCTEPSAGRTSDGPCVAYVHPLPEPSQNDQ